MILYHTSRSEIRNPDIRVGRKNADFGPGFYLTPDREFALRWARDGSVINKYEFDAAGLSVVRFSRSTEWFGYIFHNRRGTDTVSADVIDGPIANDTIFDTLGVISSGYLTPGDALKLLMIGPEYRQIALKTEKAASRLRWTGSERTGRPDPGALEVEQTAYIEEFAAILAEIG